MVGSFHFRHIAQLLSGLVLALLLSLPASVVHAQSEEPTAFQIQRFRPQVDPAGGFQLQSGKTLQKQWELFLSGTLNYALEPLILRNTDGSKRENGGVLTGQLGFDFVGGVAVLSWLDIRLRLPMTLFQDGAIPNTADFGTARNRNLTGSFTGDMSLLAKAQVLHQKKHQLDLSLQLELGLPTGDDTTFNGEGGVWVGFQAFLSRSFLKNRLLVAFNLGYRYLPPTQILKLVVANELSYGLSARFKLLPRRLDLIAELFGATALSEFTSPRSSPFDWALGARVYPMKNNTQLALNVAISSGMSYGFGSPQFRVIAGLTWRYDAGDRDKDGLRGGADKCPSTPGPAANNGCPWKDTDGDGLKDNVDKCPKVKGPTSNQGCPILDVDKDGVLGQNDKCPKVKGPAANKGCPWKDSDFDGIHDGIDKCPKQDGPAANKGCPDKDTDGDGVPDRTDKCPKRKGVATNNGCPKIVKDSDGDGLKDDVDKCPYIPSSSLQSKRRRRKAKKVAPGCPARQLITVSKVSIQVGRKLRFSRRSTRLYRADRPVLRQVADVLQANKAATLTIEVHTDNRQSRRRSLYLSIRRAQYLRSLLKRYGVSPKRIVARGLGSSKPLVSNKTRKGRRKNNRVILTLAGM